MPLEMTGRRVATVEDITQAGDYCGPVSGCVFYLLPNSRDADAHGMSRVMRHVKSPPHVFTEEPDGSLTIRESIGAQPFWHGFLTEGRWELHKSK